MIDLHNVDCLQYLKTLADNSVDAVITDPPYGMSQHSQQDIIKALTAWLAGEEYKHGKAGFMGKEWDSFVPSPTIWKEVLRVLKPGGHILCAASTRTVDLMGISLRLAGFEIRDSIEWLYGSGFPKSLDISKAIDKEAGVERDIVGIKQNSFGRQKGGGAGWAEGITGEKIEKHDFAITVPATEAAKQFEGFGTALKPAHEPFILARKPIEKGLTIAQNCLKWGTGGLDIDSSRIPTNDDTGRTRNGIQHLFSGLNKHESKTHEQGRFPANVIHDGAECVVSLFPDVKSGGGNGNRKDSNGIFPKKGINTINGIPKSEGSAARFFYCAKASPSERNKGLDGFELKESQSTGWSGESMPLRQDGTERKMPLTKNHHPTVKPLRLCEYLIKLISKEGDLILDPFAGSGTTLVAAKKLGRRAIGCELHTDYYNIAKARIDNTPVNNNLELEAA